MIPKFDHLLRKNDLKTDDAIILHICLSGAVTRRHNEVSDDLYRPRLWHETRVEDALNDGRRPGDLVVYGAGRGSRPSTIEVSVAHPKPDDPQLR